MDEKLYKVFRSAAVTSLVLGIVILVVGAASGVLLIVSGGKMIKQRSKIIL